MQAAEDRAQAAEANAAALARQIAERTDQITTLEREVANADNVRSFAVETERVIAALQRDLREARAKLAQITLERDRLESEVRDARVDTDTTSRRAPGKPVFDPDITAEADIARYGALIAKSSELEQKVAQLESEDHGLRRQLADAEDRLQAAEDRLRAAIDINDEDDDDSDLTRTGHPLPIAEVTEHVTVLEESINSLRANMRAASDETAMMEPSESVNTISTAVSQAAEHVEVARAAIRALAASIGVT
ncbi:MAG: hypothetical protein H7138_13975 [Myxococcales bacterium]|nr:hypothetical protein [Myxococcales bacterium]